MPFLPVETKANMLYVNINFPGNLFYGFVRYCGKVVSTPTDSLPFWAPVLAVNVLSNFFHVDSC